EEGILHLVATDLKLFEKRKRCEEELRKIAPQIDEAINSSLEIAEEIPEFVKLATRLQHLKISLVCQRYQLISALCSHVIQNMPWGHTEQKKILAFAAFFHDILLEEHVSVQGNGDEKLQFSENEKEIFLEHALKTTALLKNYPHIPLGADLVILQHHGRLRGEGSANYAKKDFSAFSLIFIAAERFLDIFLKQEMQNEERNLTVILSQLKKELPYKQYQKIIETFESLKF
ncbi:MAG: hypothetical protein KBD63_07160, partial [Bacteriovoracaceae bacterium]|nr:hypothetical protein [Bacteriovoracaceae bacterium]